MVVSAAVDVPRVLLLAIRLALDPVSPAGDELTTSKSVCSTGGLTEQIAAEARRTTIQGERAYSDTRWFDSIRRHGATAGVGDLAARVFATSSGRVYVPVAKERAEILALRRDPMTVFRVTLAATCANAQTWARATGRAATAPDLALAHVAGIDDALRMARAPERDRNGAASELLPTTALEQPGLFFEGTKPRSVDDVMLTLAAAIGTGGAHKHAPQHVVAAPHAQPKTKPPTSVAGWRIDITRVR